MVHALHQWEGSREKRIQGLRTQEEPHLSSSSSSPSLTSSSESLMTMAFFAAVGRLARGLGAAAAAAAAVASLPTVSPAMVPAAKSFKKDIGNTVGTQEALCRLGRPVLPQVYCTERTLPRTLYTNWTVLQSNKPPQLCMH